MHREMGEALQWQLSLSGKNISSPSGCNNLLLEFPGCNSYPVIPIPAQPQSSPSMDRARAVPLKWLLQDMTNPPGNLPKVRVYFEMFQVLTQQLVCSAGNTIRGLCDSIYDSGNCCSCLSKQHILRARLKADQTEFFTPSLSNLSAHPKGKGKKG